MPLSARARTTAMAVAASWMLSSPAGAHLVTTGLGPYYDGATHLLQSADDLLPALCLALLAGLNGKAAARRALFLLPAAWWLAGLAGYAMRSAPLPGLVAALSLLAAGLLTALDLRLSEPSVAGLAALLGGLHGWSNGAALAADGREAQGLAGTALALFVLVALVAAGTVTIRRPGLRVAVRVAGSWGAAIGLLMLGWALRGS